RAAAGERVQAGAEEEGHEGGGEEEQVVAAQRQRGGARDYGERQPDERHSSLEGSHRDEKRQDQERPERGPEQDERVRYGVEVLEAHRVQGPTHADQEAQDVVA